MSKIVSSNTTFSLRQIVVFIAIFLILITSCAVRSGIKSIAGLPISTEQGIAKSNLSSSNVIDECIEFAVKDAQIIQSFSSNENDFPPLIPFAVSFLFLFRLRLTIKENKHPTYKKSVKIRSSIPIFLEYKKLIIPFA